MSILATGGAGLSGSNFVLDWLSQFDEFVINLDKPTYAGKIDKPQSFNGDLCHVFVQSEIGDSELVVEHPPCAIIIFVAESHVERSIHGPEDFVQTDIVGSFRVLAAVRAYWGSLRSDAKQAFRFFHISTDEVCGSLCKQDPAFTESHRYEPNSPYSASKAASDNLVRAHHHTCLPVLTTNCSNNYGPNNLPEKLIPLMVVNALAGKPLPVYGDGQRIRDWLYVKDYCSAIRCVMDVGRVGEVHNIYGRNEKPNLEIVHAVCALLDELSPRPDGKPCKEQITYVAVRPGHDRCCATGVCKLERELGCEPAETFETGIRQTVQWYLENEGWVKNVTSGADEQLVGRRDGDA